eukprot:100911-Pyramimonas_sp.AAC.1
MALPPTNLRPHPGMQMSPHSHHQGLPQLLPMQPGMQSGYPGALGIPGHGPPHMRPLMVASAGSAGGPRHGRQPLLA